MSERVLLKRKFKSTLMKFYSGFSLKNENHFFNAYSDQSIYCISGFSYGAIKALRDTLALVNAGKRVDRLQLFSPAFFQTKQEKFKRLQELSFTKDNEKYLAQFLQGCFAPYAMQEIEQTQDNVKSLHELLYYEWLVSEFSLLQEKGVVVEVYLGGKDKIIDVKAAKKFFLQVATVTYIKNANHFLQTQ